MKKEWIECLIELKKLVGDRGRTNFVSKSLLDEMFVKYEINLKELERQLIVINNT